MSITPPTGNREFRDDVVRIAELTVNSFTISDLQFLNCRIIGPAVLVFRDSEITHCRWDAPSFEALFWEITPGRKQVVGAVACIRCVFSACAFEGIGMAAPPAAREHLRRGFSER